MFQSAAAKLTVWYLAIIMIISLLFSWSLYRVSSADLQHNAQRQISYFDNFLGPYDIDNYTQLKQKQLNQDLGHLRSNLVFFNIVVLAVGGAVSYWLARRTLTPIETALATQTRFAADASHELRTPLTAMQTENEVALRKAGLTKAEAIAILKSNLEEVAKLKSLAEGLLRLAKNNGQLTTQPVSAKFIADQAVARLSKAAEHKAIKLNNRTNAIMVRGEADSLVELLAVFIDNAIKYSPRGSEVKITTIRHDKMTIISVSDEGQGIAPADLPHIFERFYRTDSARTRDHAGGYGLGLAIAQKIADAHHGYIEVKSRLGAGSTFSLHLPIA